MSDPKRWMLEWDEDKGCSCGQKEHPEGDFVYHSVYAETKAAWRAAASRCISYIGQLGEQSSEIAHLKSELAMEKENEDRIVRLWQQANNEVHGQRSQIAALIDNQTRLKAEVERLKEGKQS